MISSILILAAVANGAAAETISGLATMNDVWSGVACQGNYDITKYLLSLNSEQFGTFPNSNCAPVCGHTITVSHGGKSLVATVVDRGTMEANNFDLNIAAFEYFADIGKGHFDVTWSWNDGFDPATGTQDTAGLKAVALPGSPVGCDPGAAAGSPVAAVSASVATTAAAETLPIASETTAVAAGADATAVFADPSIASVAPTGSSLDPVAPVASVVSSATSSTPAWSTGRPAGHRGGGRQSKRCAAQL